MKKNSIHVHRLNGTLGTQTCWPRSHLQLVSKTLFRQFFSIHIIDSHEEATFAERVGEPPRISTGYIELCARFQEIGESVIIEAVT